jgi:hypothetical protein
MPTAICACDAAGIASIVKATSNNRNDFSVRMFIAFLVPGFTWIVRPGAAHLYSAFFLLNPL